MKLFVAITVVIAFCSGCANNEPLHEAATTFPEPTHKHLSQLPFQTLSKGTAKLEEITTQTPAFAFEEGTSYFKAYSLPPPAERKIVYLTTFIVGAMWMPSAFVFYPNFTFLDESFSAILRVDPKLTYKNNFWNTERSGWSTEVEIPNRARYLIVHSPASKRGGRLYYKDNSYTPTGTVVPLTQGALYIPGNWWDIYLPAAMAGRFQIELQ
ncbi:MAG: hypothetical protein AB1400_03035 [Pseudomonadota bacterium]